MTQRMLDRPGTLNILAMLLWLALPSPAVADRPIIAIIIDDMGYNLERGRRALAIPGNITYSVLPHTPHTHYFAEQAAATGREVMLHMPMENHAERKLGPGALMVHQDRDEFLLRLEAALADVPHVSGINNHMGSELTEQETPMRWLMDALYEKNYFFVDSLTTPRSVAHELAVDRQLLVARRDIFLDNDRSQAAIHRSFGRLLAIARRHGTAIAIGHPYPETLNYLERAVPRLVEEGVQLLPVSGVATYQVLYRGGPILARRENRGTTGAMEASGL